MIPVTYQSFFVAVALGRPEKSGRAHGTRPSFDARAYASATIVHKRTRFMYVDVRTHPGSVLRTEEIQWARQMRGVFYRKGGEELSVEREKCLGAMGVSVARR